eukprot:TRINITY_DN7976_c0_g1_i1.p1 TRINITY_DN7976_c0_g1~~TRINITY_DN7976_c0_g1_i1.p1  ORF type:complete len:923 (+),score=348.99 TRINITY_DN7976_c0_g1_i1:94-2862(+)
MGRARRAVSADDEEAPLLPQTADARTRAAANQLNRIVLCVVCITILAVIGYGCMPSFIKKSPEETIADLKNRIMLAQRELAEPAASKACIGDECTREFLPPIALQNQDLVNEVEENVLPPMWNILLDPEKSYWLWVVLGLAFCSALLLTGALLDATGRKSKGEGWFKKKAREMFRHVRDADTFKQMTFYNPYTDGDQEPGEGNAYRLIAIVGPDICNVKNSGRKATGHDLSHGGFEFTLPSKSAYAIMLGVTFCLLVMQVYFPMTLMNEVFGSGSHYQLLGLKKIAYYNNFPERVWLQLVPLTLMSCKFFVVIERTLRSEFNQCLWLYHTAAEGGFKFQIFGKAWTFFWVTVSLVVNFYIGIVMTLYVVVSIATFDSAGGNLMGFILSIFGSFGLINFDDALMEALPLWANWYKQHTLMAGHPQGEHPDGESADEFFGPEGVKESGVGHDVVRWGEESQAEGATSAMDTSQIQKPLKTKFVRVGLQLTPERNRLGFYFSGTKIMKVSPNGAAAWAVDLDELKNGVYRHCDLVLDVPAGSTLDKVGVTLKPGTMIVAEASKAAFAAGVRPDHKLVEADGEHVKSVGELEKVLRGGGNFRFHEKAQIYPAFGQQQGSAPLQPIGDGERGPYLYKGKDASEMTYWDYASTKLEKQDKADGVILPSLAWPPSSEMLRVFWEKAANIWRLGKQRPVTVTATKGSTFRETFGVHVDRDVNGFLQVVSIVKGGPADQAGLLTQAGFFLSNLQRSSGAPLWTEGMTQQDLMTQFSALARGESVQITFRAQSYLQKPENSGLEPGMMIWKINGERVQGKADIQRAFRRLRGDSLKYPSCEFDEAKSGPVGWTGGTLISRDANGNMLEKEPEKGVVKEFTMTLARAADEDSQLDDIVHSVIYAMVRILLFSSLLFILATYFIDTKTGRHVGI